MTHRRIATLLSVLAVIVFSACTESATQSTDVGDLDILKAPPSQDPDPAPTGVDPDSVLQATVDTVQVMGSDFLPGDRVGWLLNGRSTDDIVTQSTEFISGGELRAIIQVAPDAEITVFDVEVRGGGKRKGIGTDLLRVAEKPGGNPNVLTPLTYTFESGPGIMPVGSSAYSDSDPGVTANISDRGQAFITTTGQKKKDPSRDVHLTVTRGSDVIFTGEVQIHAQTKTERWDPVLQTIVPVTIEDLAIGEVVEIPFRVVFADGRSNRFLRYGRECGPNTIVPGEQALLERTGPGAWTLSTVPGRVARLCSEDGEELGVTAHFSWSFRTQP